MATDLTDVLLNRQALKYQREVNPNLDISGSQFTAGNNHQMISQGIGNFLKYANAPEAREEVARQESNAAEQLQYDRDQDALKMELQNRADARAGERLSLDKDQAARQASREAKSDLLRNSQNQFQAMAFQLGDEVRGASEANQALMQDFESRGVLVQNKDGTFGLNDTATPEDIEAFKNRPDIDEMSKTNRHKLMQYVADLGKDNISGNEVGNIAAGIQMFDNAWTPSTEATTTENQAFERKRLRLQQARDEALRKTTGALGNEPEMLNMASEMASVIDGDFSSLGSDLVVKAIDANARLDQEALGEVNSWIEKVQKGSMGAKLKNQAKDKSRFEYALAKVIQRSGGDPWFGLGDFKDGDLAREVAAQLARIDMVDNVVKEQGDIQSQYASDILRAESLYNAKTTGRLAK